MGAIVNPDVHLAMLEVGVKKASQVVIEVAHKALLKHLRGEGRVPSWENFPIGRNYWLQHDHPPTHLKGVRRDNEPY